MKRRILIAFLFVAFLAALIWFFLPARESEPVYEGRPLREWLAVYFGPGPDTSTAQADDAIRHLGTNAIPILLEMLQETNSPLKLKWIALMGKQHLFKPPQEARVRNAEAARAFQALGPDASNAVPGLVRIYREDHSPESQIYILMALGSIAPAVLPAATPVLLDGLTNSDVRLSRTAAMAIGGAHGQPDVFVPALINGLKGPLQSRGIAAWSLGEYGPQAKSAVPALVDLSKNDPALSVRTQAANALKKIDPEAAAKAGVK